MLHERPNSAYLSVKTTIAPLSLLSACQFLLVLTDKCLSYHYMLQEDDQDRYVGTLFVILDLVLSITMIYTIDIWID